MDDLRTRKTVKNNVNCVSHRIDYSEFMSEILVIHHVGKFQKCAYRILKMWWILNKNCSFCV